MSKNTLTKNVVLNLDVEIKPKKFVKVNKKKKDDSNNKQLPKKMFIRHKNIFQLDYK